MSERDTQRAILDLLAAERVLAFRMQTGAILSSYKGKRRMIRFGETGMADILAFPNVRTILWIEVKAKNGKQSDEQQVFQARVEREGHEYLLARESEDVKSKLAELRAECST